MTLNTSDAFNWSLYEDGYTGGSKLISNKSIIGSNKKNKCFSRESYAQEMFDIYTNQNSNLIKKDLNKGDTVIITDIFNMKDHFMDIELSGGLTVTIDLLREKKFIQLYGYNTPFEFIYALNSKETIKDFLSNKINAYITESTPSIKVSLWQGHLKSVKDEFMEQITKPTKAYTAKIIQANKGGFFVEVQGLEAFMPGSLAAPNKIVDFQSYIGKEVTVMIEDFLKELNSFIVSHKKYLNYIIPIKIQELDLNKKYIGTVTGTSKYGIFVEFDIFTGLLHTSKMNEQIFRQFEQRLIQPGDQIEFYIAEINKDNRIILTNENPEDKLKRIQEFIFNSKGKILESTIAAIMNFGVIVNVEDLTGLILNKEFKKNKIMINNFIQGEKLNIMFDEYKDEKLLFKLPEKNI